jgi:C1A family cysteine protease
MNSFIKKTILSGMAVLLTVMGLGVLYSPAMAQEVVPAPLNPAFIEYIQNLQALGMEEQKAEGPALGAIPPPLDLSHLVSSPLEDHGLVAAPPSYDLRYQGKLTPVKDQGNCGSCWSFATYGSLESALLPNEAWDFSENNLKNKAGFNNGHCSGGNAIMSTAYLARWDGPINEADDPYNPLSNVSPPGLKAVKHVQEVSLIPNRAGSLNNDVIKQAVMTYGALYTHMYWDNYYYNAYNYAYYYSGTTGINHAVAIVGWDDNFDRSKFNTAPPGNGAFIIKNSWGTSWGEGGFFYLSYYDSRAFTYNTMFHAAEPTSNYDYIHQYDPLGWVMSVGYNNSTPTTAWFSNIFTPTVDESLKAVSFYTTSLNASYEIYIYSNVASGPRSGTLAGSKSGTIPSAGYHTISFDVPISISVGQKFSVVVKLTTPGYNYPIATEYPLSGYSSNATANAGESYVSSDGNTWSDLTSYYARTNVCLKAFTFRKVEAVTLISPSGTITDTTPTYMWNAVSEVTWYYLWVDDSTGNKIQQWYRASEAGCPSGTGTCSVTPDIKLAGGPAKWWIQTYYPGREGPWSQRMDFTVSPPGAAALVSPSGAIWEAFPTFTWNAVLDSSWYYLKVDDSTGNRIQQWYRASEAGCASGTGTCSVKPTTKLQRGAGKFLVQTYSTGGTGPWSTAMNFTVTPATLVSPSGSTTDPTPTYTWGAVSGSTWYFLWVDDSAGTKIQQWYRAADAGCGSGTGSCSITPPTQLTGGQAKWWIMTYINGGEGPWSPGKAFAVTPPPAATLISPSGTITTTRPTYTWNAVPDSTWYFLWVDDSTGNKIQQWYRASEAGCPAGTGTCSATPNISLATGPGKWWIQTWSPAGDGPWSSPRSFTVSP